MKILPKPKQWKNWSLPSKYTAIGLLVGLVALIIGAIQFFKNDNSTENKYFVINIANPTNQNEQHVEKSPFIKSKKEANLILEKGSLSFWFKLYESHKGQKRYLANFVNYYDNDFLEMFISSNKIIQYNLYDIRNNKYSLVYNNKNTYENWTHAVVTWGNKKSMDLYMNASKVASTSIKDSDFRIPIKDWYFGAYHQERYGLIGSMDEVRLYNRELNKEEISELYKLGRDDGYADFPEIPKK